MAGRGRRGRPKKVNNPCSSNPTPPIGNQPSSNVQPSVPGEATGTPCAAQIVNSPEKQPESATRRSPSPTPATENHGSISRRRLVTQLDLNTALVTPTVTLHESQIQSEPALLGAHPRVPSMSSQSPSANPPHAVNNSVLGHHGLESEVSQLARYVLVCETRAETGELTVAPVTQTTVQHHPGGHSSAGAANPATTGAPPSSAVSSVEQTQHPHVSPTNASVPNKVWQSSTFAYLVDPNEGTELKFIPPAVIDGKKVAKIEAEDLLEEIEY